MPQADIEALNARYDAISRKEKALQAAGRRA
jgi:hypothetical protein